MTAFSVSAWTISILAVDSSRTPVTETNTAIRGCVAGKDVAKMPLNRPTKAVLPAGRVARGGIVDRGHVAFVNRDQEPRAGQARLRTGRSSRYEVDYQIVETG